MGSFGSPFFIAQPTMSQVSTEAFDFIFATKNKLEDRADRLETRIDRAQEKLDKLLSKDSLTGKQERQAGRLEGLIGARTGRLVALEADIAEYEAFPLPQDELVINYDPNRGSRFNTTVFLQESPYDDLFDAGEYVRVGVRAWNESKGGSTWSSQLTLNHPEYTGDKYVLGDSTFTYANITVPDKVFGYERAEVYIEVGGETLQTLQLV